MDKTCSPNSERSGVPGSCSTTNIFAFVVVYGGSKVLFGVLNITGAFVIG